MAVLMAQGQVGHLQVIGQVLGLPVELPRHGAAGLLEIEQPPIAGDHIGEAAAGPPLLVFPEVRLLAERRIQRRQHLAHHRIGPQGLTDALGLLDHLVAHRRQPGGLGFCAVGGAGFGVAGDRWVRGEPAIDPEGGRQQGIDQIALDHVTRGNERRCPWPETMAPGPHRAGHRRLERCGGPGGMAVILRQREVAHGASSTPWPRTIRRASISEGQRPESMPPPSQCSSVAT